MITYTWRGIAGAAPDYYNPAAWTVNGAATATAPGPGDTAMIAFPGPANSAAFVAPGATKGDVVSGQTVNFSVADSTRLRVAQFNGTILDASTTANFTGVAQVDVNGSTGLRGVVNVGTPAGAADLQLLLIGAIPRTNGDVPNLGNAGTVNVAGGSKLELNAQVGGGGLGNPYNGTRFEVRNQGTFNVSGGSTL